VVRKTTAALALLVGLLVAGPAHAGGGHMAPVQERYDPGQAATLVGYTGDPVLTALPEEPFYAYLRPAGESAGSRLLRSDIYVGELVVEETRHRGYLRFRVSLTFTVPAYLEAGDYDVVYCTDPCTSAWLGDLVGGQLSVGVEPLRRVVRYWAPDEPEIANLAPDAVLVGPGFSARAADLRSPPAQPAAAHAPATTAPAPAPAPAPAAGTGEDEMAWPLPTALVVVAAAGTALVLSRRLRPGRPTTGWGVPGARSGDAAPAGRG
jgi:hypothetical protein